MRIFKKIKLGIVGHGFVGKATDWGFNKKVEKINPEEYDALSDRIIL